MFNNVVETFVSVVSSREWQTLVILATLVAFLYFESSQRKTGDRKTIRRSYFTNISLFVVNDTVMSILSVSSLLLIAADYAHVGILDYIPNPIGKVMVSFLLYDLTLYFWHKIRHANTVLWQFHRVHHSDLSVNVTTAFRLHAVEVFLTTVVKAVLILVVGMDMTFVLLNEGVITFCALFHHADISVRGETWFRVFLIVPSLHRLHHSVRHEEYDTNFGAVLTVWDRVFGTFAEGEPKRVGIEDVPHLWPLQLILYGFRK